MLMKMNTAMPEIPSTDTSKSYAGTRRGCQELSKVAYFENQPFWKLVVQIANMHDRIHYDADWHIVADDI